MNLQGKHAVITGGTRLGRIVAQNLAKAGTHMLLTYHHSKRAAEQTVREAKKFGVKVFVIRADLSREKEVKKVFAAAKKCFGKIDIIIAMASTFSQTPWKKLNEKTWKFEMENTLTTALLTGKIGADIISETSKTGIMIFFGDAKVENFLPNRIPYYVAKAGVHMLIKLFAQSLSSKIKVYGIAPNRVLTPTYLLKKGRKKIDRSSLIGKTVFRILKQKPPTGKIFRIG